MVTILVTHCRHKGMNTSTSETIANYRACSLNHVKMATLTWKFVNAKILAGTRRRQIGTRLQKVHIIRNKNFTCQLGTNCRLCYCCKPDQNIGRKWTNSKRISNSIFSTHTFISTHALQFVFRATFWFLLIAKFALYWTRKNQQF